MKREGFLTVDNMKVCEDVFARFMRDKYDMDVSTNARALRKVLYNAMRSVDDAVGGTDPAVNPLKRMNDFALNRARDIFLLAEAEVEATKRDVSGVSGNNTSRPSAASKTPSSSSRILERESSVFGDRAVVTPTLSERPQMTTSPDNAGVIDKQFERILAERTPAASITEIGKEKERGATMLATVELDEKMTDRDFSRQMEAQASERKRIDAQFSREEKSESEEEDESESEDEDESESEHEKEGEGENERKRGKGSEGEAEQDVYEDDEDEKQGGKPRGKVKSKSKARIAADQGIGIGSTSIDQLEPSQSSSPSVASVTPTAPPGAAAGAAAASLPVHVPIPAPGNTFSLTKPPYGNGGEIVKMSSFVKYLSVNGSDRDWTKEPFRYRYTVRTTNGNMTTTFRDIVAMQATSIIVPMEIVMNRDADTRAAFTGDKAGFVHNFGFPYPYAMLAIEGFEDVYDGTNDEVRQAFCKFTYKREFRSPSGRGFILLEPMQDEIKRFEPAPMASLRNLSISLLKPNGTLLNNSQDDYNVFKIEYEEFNRYFIKVVLDKHFDRNEFFTGDNVTFRDVRLSATDDVDDPSPSPLKRLEAFLSRREGHDILEVGAANASGFHRSFYIYAPGTFDQTAGRLDLDSELLGALVRHNDASDTTTAPSATGHLMNTSLQNVMTFRLWMSRPDVKPLLGSNFASELRTFPDTTGR